MAREILAIQDLDKTSPEFQRELIAVADRRGLDPSYLAAVIHFESGFNPQAENPLSHCVGLIQFCMPQTVGTTHAELKQMSDVEQLEYVERHYEKVDPNKRVKSLEDHYLAVLAPACIGYPPSAVMPCISRLSPWERPAGGCTRPLRGPYCQNKGLDRNGDGVITTWEATTPVRSRVNLAQGKPPIVVDDAPNGDKPPPPIDPFPVPVPLQAGIGIAGLLPLAAAAIVGYYGYTFVADGMKTKRRRR